MKKLRLKKKVKQNFLILLTIIVGSFIGYRSYKNYVYHNSLEYKLLQRGYSEDDISVFNESIPQSEMERLVNARKDNNIIKIATQKYYLKKNYDRYMKYLEIYPETKYEDLIAIINVNADYEWYDEKVLKNTDVTKEDLMLVNKFNKLTDQYAPEDIINMDLSYAYADNKIRTHVEEAYKKMAIDAKNEGLSLIANSSYRSYSEQEYVYNKLALDGSIESADRIAARPGHSEHQSGLTIDILTRNVNTSTFEQTAEFAWLVKNAHRYGFILRYPQDKMHITGYAYESWHYRYLGADIATKVYEEGITYDEYYAYYLE